MNNVPVRFRYNAIIEGTIERCKEKIAIHKNTPASIDKKQG
jgi:hypothetical protein